MRSSSLLLALLLLSPSAALAGDDPPPLLQGDPADAPDGAFEGAPPEPDRLPEDPADEPGDELGQQPERRRPLPSRRLEDPPRAGPKKAAAAKEEEEWDGNVALASGAGCLAGGVLWPVVLWGVGIPAITALQSNGTTSNDACASMALFLACGGLGLIGAAPCSAVSAAGAGALSASLAGRDAWPVLLGSIPGVLLSGLSAVACLCALVPYVGWAALPVVLLVSALGGPLVVAGASFGDADVLGRVFPPKEPRRDDGMAY